MSFFEGQYFGVAESAGAGALVLERFVVAVEAALPAGDDGITDASTVWHVRAARPCLTEAGTMSFFKGRYFGVAESAGAGAFVLERFVVAVEAALPAGDEWHH